MSPRAGVCEALRLAVEAVRPSRGGAPQATALHLAVLLSHASRGPLGRPRLASLLGLGEAPTRTLLSRALSLGLVDHGPRGYTLTPKGASVLESLARLIKLEDDVEAPGLDDVIALVVDAPGPGNLTGVYRVRDYIVMEECRTVVVGRCSSGVAELPGAPNVAHVGECPEGSLVVIVPRECAAKAFNGVLRMLLEEHCR